jgi:hypothetical protein
MRIVTFKPKPKGYGYGKVVAIAIVTVPYIGPQLAKLGNIAFYGAIAYA